MQLGIFSFWQAEIGQKTNEGGDLGVPKQIFEWEPHLDRHIFQFGAFVCDDNSIFRIPNQISRDQLHDLYFQDRIHFLFFHFFFLLDFLEG